MVTRLVNWPNVIGEFETISRLLDGLSISRCGDGEAKLAFGKGYRREQPNTALARELRDILTIPNANCLVGIPTLDPMGAKYESWIRHEERFLQLLSPEMKYHSAFISRPDSAQWIMCREYAEEVQKLWAGKKAAVVCEPDNSMLGLIRETARETNHIECPSSGAYAMIKQFRAAILKLKPDVAILSVGPTATCLAHRLSNRVQAIDIGSAGGFLRKLLA